MTICSRDRRWLCFVGALMPRTAGIEVYDKILQLSGNRRTKVIAARLYLLSCSVFVRFFNALHIS